MDADDADDDEAAGGMPRDPLRLAGMLNPRRVLMVHAKRQECAPLSSAPCRVRDEAR